MIRLLLIIVGPLILPAAVYVIWRTFVPPKFGGSAAIARDQWEPLPWPWLLGVGGVLMVITLTAIVLFPEIFGGF
ncbi:MAG: hypothetical protein HQ511_14790 [Rhodospirillales bacterium]|nr:hypothetical protein [Rhodospirillales bacterium]